MFGLSFVYATCLKATHQKYCLAFYSNKNEATNVGLGIGAQQLPCVLYTLRIWDLESHIRTTRKKSMPKTSIE